MTHLSGISTGLVIKTGPLRKATLPMQLDKGRQSEEHLVSSDRVTDENPEKESNDTRGMPMVQTEVSRALYELETL